ncbi:PEP-utilizing enzyme [Lacrimispora sp.]|uniref:PEP-utilizing enzyme n=1 Tax=Lacrimispora sp. TaxID=2719234 RepID=UPI0034601777
MGKARLKAVVTAKGSSCSHMAILAKNLGIPAIVGVGTFPENIDGKQGTADTGAGKLFIGQV